MITAAEACIFEHLFPGEDGYSRSESLWLVRGGRGETG
ncbi:rhsB domain protein [Escherichia coli TW06591]|nr:rhsB domain protein [Escherichia coli TW06591]